MTAQAKTYTGYGLGSLQYECNCAFCLTPLHPSQGSLSGSGKRICDDCDAKETAFLQASYVNEETFEAITTYEETRR